MLSRDEALQLFSWLAGHFCRERGIPTPEVLDDDLWGMATVARVTHDGWVYEFRPWIRHSGQRQSFSWLPGGPEVKGYRNAVDVEFWPEGAFHGHDCPHCECDRPDCLFTRLESH